MTASSDEGRIRDLAMYLRRALESVPRSKLPITMQEFPRGACGDASLLLGALLADHGLHGFKYVSAARGRIDDGTWTSHAWLASGSLVVDITADQFPDAPAAVIVARNSAWHDKFTVEKTHPSDFRATYSTGNGDLQTLLARLQASYEGGISGVDSR